MNVAGEEGVFGGGVEAQGVTGGESRTGGEDGGARGAGGADGMVDRAWCADRAEGLESDPVGECWVGEGGGAAGGEGRVVREGRGERVQGWVMRQGNDAGGEGWAGEVNIVEVFGGQGEA